MKLINFLFVGVTAALISDPFIIDRQADVPAYANITQVAYGGTGCPQGSAALVISNGGSTLTAIFDKYTVETYGPSARKNCQVLVDVAFPKGWTFTVIDIIQRGSATLDPQVTAELRTNFYFSGESQQGTITRTIKGPYDDNYQVEDQSGAAVYSPCNANNDAAFNINSQLKLTQSSGSRGHGLLSADSLDLKFTQVFQIVWQRC